MWGKNERVRIDSFFFFFFEQACVQTDTQRKQELIFHGCFHKMDRSVQILYLLFPCFFVFFFTRKLSECMVRVNCKLKYCIGLDFSHTVAISLSTASLQQTKLPLLQLICDIGWWSSYFSNAVLLLCVMVVSLLIFLPIFQAFSWKCAVNNLNLPVSHQMVNKISPR